MIALLLAASLPTEGLPLKFVDGGFCAGISWISPSDPAGFTVDDGPDFRVYRYDGPNGKYWGVYSGNAAQVSYGKKAPFLERDYVKVNAVVVDGQFRGYLATDRRGWQNHFFGSVFHNDPSDMEFFKQVDFGPKGQAKCKSYNQ
jgi:hypothetical protein